MKKLLLLLLTVFAMAMTAQADMLCLNANNHHQLKKNKVAGPCLNQDQVSELMKSCYTRFKSVITTMPEGELRTYERTGGQGIFLNQDQLGLDLQSGKMDMVFADDNVVYLKNILFNFGATYGLSWVQGTLSEDGTTITVPMGQSIYWSDYYQAEIVLCMGSTQLVYENGEPRLEFTIDNSVTEVVYTIDGDKITLQGTQGSDATGQDMDRWNAYGLSCC